VTQRRNRREPIFFRDGDQEVYGDLLAEQTFERDIEVWAYRLVPNHVHLILAPSDETGLGRAAGEAHRRTTNFINARGRWTGHLFQSRFSSVAMDESHPIAAVRHVSLNPVQAPMARKAEDWAWSSVRAHLTREYDELVSVAPVLNPVDRFAALLESDPDDGAFRALRSSEGSQPAAPDHDRHRRPHRLSELRAHRRRADHQR
jgi:putative transposase